MKVNINKDNFFLKLVENKIISVSKDGSIINLVTNNKIGYKANNGYICIGYKYNGKVVNILVHRLVYLVYVNNFIGDLVINHINGNKTDNRVENLEAITILENNIHALENGLVKPMSKNKREIISKKFYGEKSNMAKIKNNEAILIRKLYKEGKYTHKLLAEKFNVGKTTICDILNNVTFKNL